jgi:hypothetical protein
MNQLTFIIKNIDLFYLWIIYMIYINNKLQFTFTQA